LFLHLLPRPAIILRRELGRIGVAGVCRVCTRCARVTNGKALSYRVHNFKLVQAFIKGGSTGSADTGQSVKKEDELSGRLRQRFAYYLRDVAHNAGWHYLARQPVDQRALRHSTTQPIHVSQHHPTPHHITSQHFKTRHIATHHATSHHRRPHDAASHHSTSGDLGLSPFRSASST